MHHELLIDLTGVDGHYWVTLIQQSIPNHLTPTDDPNHPRCDAEQWLNTLSKEVWRRVQIHNDLTKFDENILAATAMSLILALWHTRLRRVKAYDPRRPIAGRRAALERLTRCNLALMSILSDEADDHRYFPLPEFDPPYAPNATDGSFV